MSTQRHPYSPPIIRLKFAKTEAAYGLGRIAEWETSHGGREYKLAKRGTSGKWYLYVRSNDPRVLLWELVRPMKGFHDFGTRLDDAKHNVTIYLCLGQNANHANWRD